MADFTKALKIILKHEGGYVNNPNDLGGETYAGISRIHHPGWIGWSVLDQLTEPKRWNQFFEVLDGYVEQFYFNKGLRKQIRLKVV